MAEMYCYVENGIKLDGPFDLLKKKSYRNISVPYALTEQQRLDVGLWPYVDEVPEYNTDTQYLTFEDVVGASTVTKTYTVNDYTAGEMETRIADAKVARKVAIRREAQTGILADYPLWMQANVANGIYGAGIGDPMKAHIANVITESNTCEDAVDAAITLAAIRAIKPTWPEVI